MAEHHIARWNTADVPSRTYLCRLTVGSVIRIIKYGDRDGEVYSPNDPEPPEVGTLLLISQGNNGIKSCCAICRPKAE